MYVVTTKIRRE